MKLLLLTLLFSCQCLMALAYDVKVNNIFYKLDREHHTATVTFEKEQYDDERTDYRGNVIVADAIEAEGEIYLVNAIGDYAFSQCYQLTSVVLPNAIEIIGNNAFSLCTMLENVSLPNNLKVIGTRAFYHCDHLITAIIPNQVSIIGPEAFCECYLLMNVYIPHTVTDIGYDAFYECEYLTNVYLADLTAWCNINFATIYSNPLYYARHLMVKGKQTTNLVIPQTVTDIKPYAFVGCRSITSLKLPNSLYTIGEMAFYNCPNLLEITIPASVELIDYQAFKFCTNTGVIYLYNPETRIEEDAFSFCHGSLHVMKGYKAQYESNTDWEDFLITDDVPTFCAPPVITFTNGQLHITSSTPGATCHLMQTFGEVQQDHIIRDLPLSAYATAEGYQPSKIVTVWLKELSDQ